MDDHDNHVEWRKCLKRREELEEKWSTQQPRTTWPLKQLIKRISELKRNTPGPATQPRHTTELLRARREAEQVEVRDLESKLHTEQRRHQETLKNLRERTSTVSRNSASRESVSGPGQTPEHTDTPTLISTIPSLIFTMSTCLTLHQHLHVTDAVWDVLPINGNRKVDTETLRGKCSHLLSIHYAEATPPAADLMETDLHQVDMTRERKADCGRQLRLFSFRYMKAGTITGSR
ncbi:hypothetical protein Bbelb_283400 [Branchiostoma belcheri]|nr:hypothetical protein Bbelb_283400 [Branchiostoma belcheri]